MKHELLLSGIGGQGIMVLGETLCAVAIEAGYNVTFVPFYGQEKRGGRTMCNIVISDGMESPIISAAEIMLIMDNRSLVDFEEKMDPKGLMLVNSSMVDAETKRDDYKKLEIPFNEIALNEVGNAKTANIVALGAVMKQLPFLPIELAEKELEKSFAKKPKVIPMNIKALRIGYDM